MKRKTNDGKWCWSNVETLLKIAKLGGEHVAVYVALTIQENSDIHKGESFSTSREQLSIASGFSVRTVAEVLKALERGGFVRIISGRNVGGLRQRNRYTLLSPMCAAGAHIPKNNACVQVAHTCENDACVQVAHNHVAGGAHIPCVQVAHTIKKERNIEPGPSRPRDSIEEEKKASHENMSGLRPANSQPEENVVPVDFNPIPACFRNKALMERL
jgi:hypothetical protein